MLADNSLKFTDLGSYVQTLDVLQINWIIAQLFQFKFKDRNINVYQTNRRTKSLIHFFLSGSESSSAVARVKCFPLAF